MGQYLFNFTRKGAAKGKTLREQAAELMKIGLWGIGSQTPNRSTLAAGDEALIYVGAPESSFVGHVRLASGTRRWTPDEAARYPGGFEEGVAFVEANVWDRVVPMKTVLPRLRINETNPNAHFFAGVVRIVREDYDVLLGEIGAAPTEPTVAADRPTETPRSSGGSIDQLYQTAEKLRDHVREGVAHLSEYDTRAHFIDKYLEALGYAGIQDVQRGTPVDSGDFPDYILRINGNPALAIEAKKLGASLGAKEAAQVVGYCANLGVRWGAVTDGRFIKVYDAPVLGVPPSDRLVMSVDLADFEDREDFETTVYPKIALIAREELETGGGLERWVAQEAIRELLTTSNSRTLRALRKELEEAKKISIPSQTLADLLSEMLS